MARELTPLHRDVQNLLYTKPEIFQPRQTASGDTLPVKGAVRIPTPRLSNEDIDTLKPDVLRRQTWQQRLSTQVGRLTLGVTNTERQEG